MIESKFFCNSSGATICFAAEYFLSLAVKFMVFTGCFFTNESQTSVVYILHMPGSSLYIPTLKPALFQE